MNEPENKPKVVSFIEVAKKKYYSPTFRELSHKKQLHLIDIVTHDDQVKKGEVGRDDGPDIA